MSAKIQAATNIEVDFSDCQVPIHDPATVALKFAAIEHEVREQLDSFGAELGSVGMLAGAMDA